MCSPIDITWRTLNSVSLIVFYSPADKGISIRNYKTFVILTQLMITGEIVVRAVSIFTDRFINREHFLAQPDLSRHPFYVQSRATFTAVQHFVDIVQGADIITTTKNCQNLMGLAKEFGFPSSPA
jgi:hypothetical protein